MFEVPPAVVPLAIGVMTGSITFAINVWLFVAVLIIAIIVTVMTSDENAMLFAIGLILGALAGFVHAAIKNAVGGNITLVWPHEIRLY